VAARSIKKKRKKKKKSAARPAAAGRRPAPAKSRAAKRVRDDSLAREKARLRRNKQLVLAFYAKMIGEKDPEAARRFMGEPYVQHSPYAKDGFEGVAEFARTFKRDFPNHTYDVKRVIAEGDYVMLHLHGKQGLSPHGEAVIDVFRVARGKVVEHWDVIQPLPEHSENPNGPF
jgi:predicted SnoaL-like aldol condensation-catalyzing enzyme